jgi:hypothetical protein
MAAIGWLYYPRPSCGRHRCQVVASRLDVIIRQVRPHFFALTALGYARKTWKILISGMTSPNRLRSALPPATNDDIVLAIPRSAVWHRQEVVSPK